MEENEDLPEKENNENSISEIIKKNLRPPAGYKVATELYVNTEDKFELGSKQSKSTWKLYVAKPEFQAIEDIIFDENGFVNPKRANDFSVGKASKEDIGKIIGKRGKTIMAIRSLVSGAAGRLKKRVTVEVVD